MKRISNPLPMMLWSDNGAISMVVSLIDSGDPMTKPFCFVTDSAYALRAPYNSAGLFGELDGPL